MRNSIFLVTANVSHIVQLSDVAKRFDIRVIGITPNYGLHSLKDKALLKSVLCDVNAKRALTKATGDDVVVVDLLSGYDNDSDWSRFLNKGGFKKFITEEVIKNMGNSRLQFAINVTDIALSIKNIRLDQLNIDTARTGITLYRSETFIQDMDRFLRQYSLN